jgi:hypothetical protein
MSIWMILRVTEPSPAESPSSVARATMPIA